MKKKLFALLLIIIVAFTMLFTTACGVTDFLVKNDERNLTQLTSSVEYAGRKAQVDKLELYSTVYNFVYTYYSYYQQGYINEAQYRSVLDSIPDSFDSANESLAEEAIYVLKCIEYLEELVKADGTVEQKAAVAAASTAGKSFTIAGRTAEIESLLTAAQLKAAREAYNEDMQKLFDGYRDEYEEELDKAGAVTKDTDNIKSVNIVTLPAVIEYEVGAEELEVDDMVVSVTYEDDTTVTLERSDFTVTGFNSEAVAEEQEITVTFGGETATFNVSIIAAKPTRPVLKTEEEEEDVTVPDLFEVKLATSIEDAQEAENDEEYAILKEAKRRLDKYMKEQYRTFAYYYLSALEDEVETAVEEVLVANVAVTDDEIAAEYQDRLASERETLLSEGGYADKLKENPYTTIVHDDADEGYFYVQHILFKQTADLTARYEEFKAESSANEEALAEYRDYLSELVGVWVSNTDYDSEADEEENEGEERFVNQEIADEYGLTVDQDGTINVLDLIDTICVQIETTKSEYAASDTEEQQKQILDTFKTWIYRCNDDEGLFTSFDDNVLGYKLGKTESDYVDSFTALSRALAYGGTAEEDSEYHIVGTGVGAYGWCYTEYGIHIIMVSGYVCNTDSADVTALAGDDYALGLDYVTNVTEYAENEDGTVDGTLREYLRDILQDEKEASVIGDFKKAFYQNELENNSKATYYDNYKDLVESFQE